MLRHRNFRQSFDLVLWHFTSTGRRQTSSCPYVRILATHSIHTSYKTPSITIWKRLQDVGVMFRDFWRYAITRQNDAKWLATFLANNWRFVEKAPGADHATHFDSQKPTSFLVSPQCPYQTPNPEYLYPSV